MTSSGCFTPPRVPTGGATHRVEHLHNTEHWQRKAESDDWENEDGRVAATHGAGQEPFSIDTETVASMPPIVMEQTRS
jgi:hypothetical protein